MFNTFSRKIKFILVVLLFGGLWGLFEATIGSILHLPFFDKAGFMACSTTVMLPIAYFLMSLCYKKSRSKMSILFMGFIAGLIKFSLVILVGFRQSIIVPSISILLESSLFFVSVCIFRPTSLLSCKHFATIAFSSTLYLFSFLVMKQITGKPVFTDVKTWVEFGELYLLKANMILLVYVSCFMGLIKLISIFIKKASFKVNISKLSNVIFSPIFVFTVFAAAVSLTFVLW